MTAMAYFADAGAVYSEHYRIGTFTHCVGMAIIIVHTIYGTSFGFPLAYSKELTSALAPMSIGVPCLIELSILSYVIASSIIVAR